MRALLVAACLSALALAGCSDDGSPAGGAASPTSTGGATAADGSPSAPPAPGPGPAPPRPAETHEVVMRSNLFEPADLAVRVGDTVHWTTEDVQAHNVVSESEAASFRSADVSIVPLLYAQDYSYTFTAPGTVDYLCEYHSGMVGTITVSA